MADHPTDNLHQPTKSSSSPAETVVKGEKSETSADKELGFIDSLAHRSTGLPGTSRARPASGEKSPWHYAGLGFQFAGTTLLFVFFGYQLDKHMGWSPWGLVSLGMIGVIGSLYLLIKDALKENADGPPKRPTGGKS